MGIYGSRKIARIFDRMIEGIFDPEENVSPTESRRAG
jgi:hypothetical protein